MKQSKFKRENRFTKLCTVIFLLLALLVLIPFPLVSAEPGERLYVTFIDVGQGDSSHLRTSSGINILIDAGPKSAGQTVVNFLIGQGVNRLDVVVMSHNHADHIGGLVELLDSSIQIDVVLYNGLTCITLTCEQVWAAMDDRGLTPIPVSAGDIYEWGSLTTTILNPQAPLRNDENEDSVVMDVVFYDSRLLFTGDIGFSTETVLIEEGMLHATDVLKVAHHGSKNSTSEVFLEVVKPQKAVISVGKNNYGHPSEETLNRLIDSGAAVLRTDEQGNIAFSFYEIPVDTTIFMPLIIISSTSTQTGAEGLVSWQEDTAVAPSAVGIMFQAHWEGREREPGPLSREYQMAGG